MIVGISVIELHLPEARSLKGKRKVIKSLVDRIHSRYRVSVSETDFHDLHQRSEIGVAVVASKGEDVDRILDGVRRLVDERFDAIVTRWEPEVIEVVR